MKLQEIKTYYDKKHTKVRRIYFEDKNNKRHGESNKYYKNGFLAWSFTYVNGVRNGEFKKYHKNGKLSYISNFVNDVEQGLAKYYKAEGTLLYTCNYNNEDITNDTYYNEKGEVIGNGSL